MSTRSYIAMQFDDYVMTIYCHCDGYLFGVGKTLLEGYNSHDSAQQLINMGDANSIDLSIDDCYFYGRDGGEDIEPRRHNSINQLTSDSLVDYVYLYRDGSWWFSAYGEGFQLLTVEAITSD